MTSVFCLAVPVFTCLCVRDELFRQSLSRLREQVVKANTLVREANFLAEEMSKLTDYQVTLQIPAANLSANRKVRHQRTAHRDIQCRNVWISKAATVLDAAGSDRERACHPGAEKREGHPGVDHREAGKQAGGHERPLPGLEGRSRGDGKEQPESGKDA